MQTSTILLTLFVLIGFFAASQSEQIIWNSNKAFSDSDIIVKENDTLVIQSGVTVQLSNSTLTVLGVVIFNGTEVDRVTVSLKNQSSVVLSDGSTGHFEHILINQHSNIAALVFRKVADATFNKATVKGGAGIISTDAVRIKITASHIDNAIQVTGGKIHISESRIQAVDLKSVTVVSIHKSLIQGSINVVNATNVNAKNNIWEKAGITLVNQGEVIVRDNFFEGFEVAVSVTAAETVTIVNNTFTGGNIAARVDSDSVEFTGNQIIGSRVALSQVGSKNLVLTATHNVLAVTGKPTKASALISVTSSTLESASVDVSRNSFRKSKNSVGAVDIDLKSQNRANVNINRNFFEDIEAVSVRVKVETATNVSSSVELKQNVFVNPSSDIDVAGKWTVDKVNKVINATFNYWGADKNIYQRIEEAGNFDYSPFFLTIDVQNFNSSNIGYEQYEPSHHTDKGYIAGIVIGSVAAGIIALLIVAALVFLIYKFWPTKYTAI